MPGGKVSFPTEVTKDKLKHLEEKIEKKEYSIGEIIVPRVYKKFTLKNREIIETTFTTNGRKITLTKFLLL